MMSGLRRPQVASGGPEGLHLNWFNYCEHSIQLCQRHNSWVEDIWSKEVSVPSGRFVLMQDCTRSSHGTVQQNTSRIISPLVIDLQEVF
jgi:hypothetical protein